MSEILGMDEHGLEASEDQGGQGERVQQEEDYSKEIDEVVARFGLDINLVAILGIEAQMILFGMLSKEYYLVAGRQMVVGTAGEPQLRTSDGKLEMLVNFLDKKEQSVTSFPLKLVFEAGGSMSLEEVSEEELYEHFYVHMGDEGQRLEALKQWMDEYKDQLGMFLEDVKYAMGNEDLVDIYKGVQAFENIPVTREHGDARFSTPFEFRKGKLRARVAFRNGVTEGEFVDVGRVFVDPYDQKVIAEGGVGADGLEGLPDYVMWYVKHYGMRIAEFLDFPYEEQVRN